MLDLAKAFDAISHESIRKVSVRKGVPAQVIGTIEDIYTNTNTEISVGSKTTWKIKINSGVKQNCLLSPLLFNLVIDELIEKLKSKNIGVKINGTLRSVMTFTDDLVTIKEDDVNIEILIEECNEFFDMKELPINAGKCDSLRVLLVKN